MPLQLPVIQTGLEASIQQAMRNAGRNAQINLGTNSRQINALAQPLGRITGQADEFTKSMEAANARVFAFGASVGIINGVSKAFSSLVKNTIEVEKSLVEINTVLNASGDSLQKFGNKLFDVAKSTGQTFDVVAKGALELARQGLSTEETLKRINDALILSRLSGLDAQQSVEGLTAAFNSFKETGITTSQILNKLVVVSQKYSVSERDLIEGLKRSASVADQAGVSFDELVGIITTVQERTARGGAVIGNAFKTIFARIQDTSALEDLKNLGVQVTDLEGKILPATSILQNLAKEFENLTQVQQADIAKKLGGVYQLSNLLAAVKDLSSEQSKYNDIVKLSANATNEAYQKNAALNQTLASLINKVSVSAQQLGATLGAIGITDSLKGLLNFFGNVLESIQNILGEESALGGLFKGLAKGIGSVLAGPGLALFAAIIAKLSKDLISFGLESLKSFFKIGQSAKEIASVEKAIAAALGSNLTLQRQLFALEGDRAAQIKLMTQAIVQQEAVMRRMATTAGSLAGPLYQQGVRSTGGQGLRVPKAAGGYMPAVSQESRDISRGVGGSKSGDKPVVIPNFAFGGGKRGPMVAHTGEFIVPNFAAGGSAIFNRDMVRSMGLPAGAQKIGAAGGFIPNFASDQKDFDQRVYEGYYERFKAAGTKPKDLETYASGQGRNKSPEYVKAAKDRLTGKSLLPQSSILNIDADRLGGLGVVSVSGGQEASATTSESRSQMSPSEVGFLDKFFGKGNIQKVVMSNIQSKSLGTIDQKLKADNQKAFRNIVKEKFTSPLVDTGAKLIGKIFKGNDQADLVSKLSSKTSDPALFSESVLGGIFESAIRVATKSVEQIGAFDDVDTKAAFDFEEAGGASGEFIKAFGFTRALYKADAKKTANSKTIQSIIGKSLRDTEVGDRIKTNYLTQAASQLNKKDLVKASSGYIPNFANPLKEAIDREMSAGVPASQIYIDKNSSLKNSMNPMGLMVANRRDEPGGGIQGVSRARREGVNPMTYGASRGFVPNYADEKVATIKPGLIEKLNNNFLGLTLGLSFLSGALDSQNRVMQSLSSIMSTVNLSLIALQGVLALTNKSYQKVLRDAETKNRSFGGAIGVAGGAVAGTALALGTAYSVGSSIYDATLDPNAPDYYKKKSLSFGEIGGYVLGRNAGVDPYALRETEKRQQDLQARIGSRQGNVTISKEQATSLGLSTEKQDRLGVSIALKEYDEALERRTQRITKEVEASYTKKPGEIVTRTTKELFESIANQIYKASKEVEKIELGARIASFFGSSLSEIGGRYSQQSSDYSARGREVVKSSLEQRPSILGDLEAEIESTNKINGFNQKKYDLLNKNLNILRSSYDVNKLDTALQELFNEGLVSNLGILQTTGSQLLTNVKTREDALQALEKEKGAAKLALDIEIQRGIQLDKNKSIYEQSVYNKSIGFEKQSVVLAGQLLTINNQIAKVKEDYSKTEYQKAREIAALEERSQGVEKASEELDILKERNATQADYITQIRQAIETSAALTEDEKINLLQDPNATLEDYKYAIDQIRNELADTISKGSFQGAPYATGLASEELINKQKSLDNLSSKVLYNQDQYNDSLNISNQRTDLLNKKYEGLTNTQKEFLRKVEGGFGAGLQDAFTGFRSETDLFEYNIGKAIPELFAKNMGDALSEAINGAKSLEDALLGAANSFLQEINSMIFKNLASNLFGGIGSFLGFQSSGEVLKRASGGMINGGSGTKDDVPAMLMGGEYVINKKAVQKYGPEFLNALNSGNLNGYAKGGVVQDLPIQSGVGGFYTPGDYGRGGIQGRQNLLDFATQTATSGQYDMITGGDNYAAINLEAESMRLTNFGRSRGQAAEALRRAKEESFGLYQQDVEAEKQRREQEKQLAEQAKASRKQFLINLAMTVASAAASSAGNAGIQGAKAGWAANAGKGFGTQLGGAFKGIFSGAQVGGAGPNVGGLGNWFSGVGSAFTGNFKQAGNYFKLSQIGNAEQIGEAMKNKNFADFMSGSGYTPAMQSENAGSIKSNGIFDWARNLFGKKENIDANGFLETGEDIKDPSQWVRGSSSTAYDFNIDNGVLPPLDTADPNALPLLYPEYSNKPIEYDGPPSLRRRATGGTIPPTTGIDTVPTMLSGGEFIMNRAASQNIGAGNLQALNAGAGSLPTEEKTEELNDRLVAKLDELIVAMSESANAGSVTINVDSNGKSTQETSGETSESKQKLATQIKDTVMKVIEQEKRLGGKLRRGL